jgi:putative ABC transport system permease protein
MSTVSRGVRGVFRNTIRTSGVTIILALSVGLALVMLLSLKTVQARITSVKSSIGNTISISPAGSRGFEGGGNPLTTAEMAKVSSTSHVVSLSESLTDRLETTQTSLVSSINPGALGDRFRGGGAGGGSGAGGGGNAPATSGGGTTASTTFTLPVTVIGTNSPSSALGSDTSGGGTLKVTSGQAFDPTKDADVAMIGSALATKNNLKVGSTFQAYGAKFTVDSIFDAGNTFSNSEFLIPLPTEQRLSDQAGDITSATATVDSIDNVSAATTDISNELGASTADVVSDQSTAAAAVAPLENIKTISFYSLVGSLVAGSIIIFLTMLMIVRERRREIGVLKAIGSSNIKIVMQFVTESLTLTLFGSILGVIAGLALSNPVLKVLVSTNTSTTTTTGGGRGGGGFSHFVGGGSRALQSLHAVVGYDVLLYGLAAAFVIAVVGSAMPAWLIAKVRPAEVMRGE